MKPLFWPGLALAGLLSLSGHAELAAPVYSLETLRRLALENNGSLRASRDQVDIARAGIVTARAYPNPELETLRSNLRPLLPGAADGPGRSAYITQRIEYPWQRSTRIDAAIAAHEGAEAEARGTRAELLARLQYRFYELLRRQAEARAASDDEALMGEISRRVGLRVKIGEAPRYELIKADAELLNAQKSRQSAVLGVGQSKAWLRQLVGNVLPERFEIDGELGHPPVPPTPEQMRAVLLERNPELERSRAITRQAGHRLDYERSQRWPSLAVKGGHSRDPELRSTSIGVVLTLPLWDWRSGPVQEAAAGLSRARNEEDQLAFSLQQELAAAWQNYQIAATQVTALESGIVHQAEATLKVAEASYRYGERGILDYLDAQRVHRSARNELIAARFDLWVAAIQIERLLASPIAIVTSTVTSTATRP